MILSGIEKLLNEHGSAVILKERIALAQDQFSIMENKLSELTKSLSEKEKQLLLSVEENELLAQENTKLKSKIDDLEKNNGQEDEQEKIPDEQERMLQLLAHEGKSLYKSEIDRFMEIETSDFDYHFEELLHKSYISSEHIQPRFQRLHEKSAPRTGTLYRIKRKGRQYLQSKKR